MGGQLETTLHELSEIQRKAVEWDDGALLVLAGPGSGKTRVLTCRVAQLLDRSRDERFRILALTFTNKAAHEMSSRVTTLAPGLEERADIHTFHGFCAEVLRQHGVHLDIKPDFAIYSRSSDRQAVLDDALERDSHHFDHGDRRLLPRIDALKARLVGPEQAEQWVSERNGASPDEASHLARAYRLYEDELRRANALDFNSLIFEAHRLFGYPAMARHYQTVYRYWLVDEFQDTNGAQYALLRRMAGENFRQVFAVADDDQTIYEWNGANVRRISTLVEDFDCEVVQLPTNFRCPPRIVEAANRLVVYNARRDESKRPAEPAQRNRSLGNQQIHCREFVTDQEEATGIAAEIAGLDIAERSQTLVLARTRALIESMDKALEAERVPATILMRRDDFVSPEMRWLVACLKQINRPLDRRNMATLVEAFGSFVPACAEPAEGGPAPLDFDDLLSRSAAQGVTYLSVWTGTAQATGLPSPAAEIVDLIAGPRRRRPETCSGTRADPRSLRERRARRGSRGRHQRLAAIVGRDQNGGWTGFARAVPSGAGAALQGTSSCAGSGISGDHSWREGPGVRHRLPHRPGGGDPALLAQHQEGERQRYAGRGAPRVLRRHHPYEEAPDPVAGALVQGVAETTVSLSGGNGLVERWSRQRIARREPVLTI